jgi:GTP-binding protein
MMIIKKAEFVKSSSKMSECPEAGLPEFAFIGRSNVGKSSLINMLTGRSKLAKTSVSPGKTKLINHFMIDKKWYLVDLPGYGYAKVSKKDRDEFGKLISNFISKRETLSCVLSLIDCRLSPQAIDIDFINWLGKHGIPFIIVFTKADKLNKTNLKNNTELFLHKLLETWEELPPSFITSSTNKTGKDEILQFIENTLGDLSKMTN